MSIDLELTIATARITARKIKSVTLNFYKYMTQKENSELSGNFGVINPRCHNLFN